MVSHENSPADVPIPALLVERAIALSRAEAGLALAHTRRLAVRAVSALLGTVVACAFAQLTLLLIVAGPLLAAPGQNERVLLGILASGVVAAGGAAFAVSSWMGVGREPARPKNGQQAPANTVSSAPKILAAEKVSS